MKNIWRKSVLVVLTFLMIAGSMILLTGCKEKKGTSKPAKPAREAVEEYQEEEFQEEALEEPAEETEDFDF